MERILGFDCETTALDPLVGQLALIQLNHNGKDISLHQVLREPDSIKDARSHLENTTTDDVIVGHNLKFDLKWVLTNGIMPDPTRIFDTMIASQLLYAGYTTADEATQRSGKLAKAYESDLEPIFDFTTEKVGAGVVTSGRFSHSLQAVLMRELGVTIKKEMQTSDWSKPLSPEQIEYAKGDVAHLPRLYKTLKQKLEKAGLTRVAEIEMQLVYVLAYLEMLGAKIDRDKWRAYAKELAAERDILKRDLEHDLGMLDGGNVGLFGAVPTPVNVNSTQKLKGIFKLPNMQGETVAKALEGDDPHPLLRRYATYNAIAKLASTYGEKYLTFAQFRDRLRGEFTQAATATGRLSSRNPNQQNVPPKIIKSNLRAEDGYVVIQCDYSQVELKILAALSGDQNFQKTCQEGDVHAANARLIFKIPDGVPVPKEQRRKAKVLSFSIPYGVSAMGLFARGLADTPEGAQQLLDDFYAAFPGVKAYLEAQEEHAIKHGFTRDAIGRIRRYEVPEKPERYEHHNEIAKQVRAQARELGLTEFQDLLFDAHKKSSKTAQVSMDTLREHFSERELESAYIVIRYQSKLSSIRREAKSHGIQGTSASITKLAMVKLQHYLQETGYGYMTLTIHDSVFFELRQEHVHKAVPAIIALMEDAGREVLGGAETPVDADAGYMENRPCACCGEKDYFFNLKFNDDYSVTPTDWDSVLCDECLKLTPEDVTAKRAERLALIN